LADFGTVVEGDTVTRTFTFANTGDADATSVYAWLSAYPDLALVANTCGTEGSPLTIGYGAGANSCAMSVAFTPSSGTSTLQGQALGVEGEFMPGPQALSLIGQGAPLTVTLASASLPTGKINKPYVGGAGYDLTPHLSISGQAPDKSKATWSVKSGSALPSGLTLSAAGLISGTPTAATAGTAVTVQANYKTKSGAQTYTLIVGDASLEVVQIAAGAYHACAITPTGGLKCWGRNNNGQLGDGTTTDSKVPLDVQGLSSGVASVSLGNSHSCAVLTTGAVACWGLNTNGQLGDTTTTARTTPVLVATLTGGARSISAGGEHTCAIRTDGALQCWGRNTYGQLGDGTVINRTAPTSVAGLSTTVANVQAGIAHTCILDTAGTAWCWGSNSNGKLGNGLVATQQLSPTQVQGLTGVAQIVPGDDHTCALLSTGAVKCWGLGSRLGSGEVDSRTPRSVTGFSSGGAVYLDAGFNHTCAITTTGTVKCWGYGGAIGIQDSLGNTQSEPVAIPTITGGASKAIAGNNFTCITFTNGKAKCFGANSYGQLGDGTNSPRQTPVSLLE
jgi:alpha-tubulin suppressor-like RCC1 family protein